MSYLLKMALVLAAGAIFLCRADCKVDYAAAQRLLALQRFSEALLAIESCVQLERNHLPALVLKGNLLYLLARDQEGVEVLEDVLKRQPGFLDAHYALGRIYYFDGRHSQAVEHLELIVRADPAHYRAWDNLGLALEGVGRLDEAVQAHLKAIALVATAHRDYDWAYANLAELLLKQNQNRRAFDLAVEAVERNPASARNAYLAGKALIRLDQMTPAERWLRRSTELDPNYPEPHYLLGQLLVRANKRELADHEFTRFKALKASAPDKRR